MNNYPTADLLRSGDYGAASYSKGYQERWHHQLQNRGQQQTVIPPLDAIDFHSIDIKGVRSARQQVRGFI